MNAEGFIEEYRRLLTTVSARDEVAQVDQEAEQLWQQARAEAAPHLSSHAMAALPLSTVVDHDAPADLDSRATLQQAGQFIRGDQPAEQTEGTAPTRRAARLFGLGWLAACLVFAIVLGATTAGTVVVPAFLLPLASGGLLVLIGPRRLPGVVWSIPLWSLAFLFQSGKPPSDDSLLSVPPQWYVAVVTVLVIEGFAHTVRLFGRADLEEGKYASAVLPRIARRPLELSLVVCTVIGGTPSADYAVIILLASIGALLWRRRWTAVAAAVICGLMLLLAFRDATRAGGGDWGHTLMLAALVAHWVRAVFTPAWRVRLTLTEIGLSITGSALRKGYRATQRRGAGRIPAAPTPAPAYGPASPAAPPAKELPKGQFMRYCASCGGSTAHISGGMSQPKCVQCRGGQVGASRWESTVERYCSTCMGTRPHANQRCLDCGN